MTFLKLLLIILLPLSLWAQSYFKSSADSLKMGNNAFELTFAASECRLQPAFLYNKIARTVHPLMGDLFSLSITFPGDGITPPRNVPRIFSTADFLIDHIKQKQLSGALQVTVTLSGQGLKLRYVIIIPDTKPYFRTILSIKDEARLFPFLQKISPWRVQIKGIQPRHGTFGQPIYTADLFMGVEFPAAYNDYQNDRINCWHYVAQKVPQDTFYTAHPVVIGLSAQGNVRTDFFAYIRTLRPRKDTPFTLYNTWYDIRDFSYDKLLTTIHNFKSTLIDKYGLKLDAFVIDDGWDDVHSVWQINRQKFPQGFTPLVRELKKIHSALGLWISPWNGYDKARTERVHWAREHGFKTSAGRHLCLGDTAYYKIFKEKVLQYQKEARLSFYKIDGFLSVCNETDHNHLPGIYSRELLTRRFIEILQALRRQNPQIFIDITVGTWLSPWWLQYADAVWMTGADYGHAEDVPAFSERDKAITFRDYTLYKDFVRDRLQFPLTNVMTHGIIKGKLNLLGGKNETLRNWQDNAVMYFSRGVMMWELYLSPEVLSSSEWEFLAGVMKWAKANTKILQHTRFVGGNPYQRQIYGYVHRYKNEILLVLRNPFVRPQKIVLTLKELTASQAQLPYGVETIYPLNYVNQTVVRQGRPLTCTLQGYEVRVLRLKPLDAFPPLPAGLYLQPVSKSKNKALFKAYIDPEENSAPTMLNAGHLKQLTFYGKAINLSDLKTIVRNALQSAKQKERTEQKIRLAFDSVTQNGIAGTLTGQRTETDSTARIGVLLCFEKPVDSLTVRFTRNGHKIPRIVKKGANGLWYWVLVTPNDRKYSFRFSFQGKEKPLSHGTVSFWNFSRKPLLELGLLGIESRGEFFEQKPEIPVNAKFKNRTERILEATF